MDFLFFMGLPQHFFYFLCGASMNKYFSQGILCDKVITLFYNI